jgi:hypothetical protein
VDYHPVFEWDRPGLSPGSVYRPDQIRVILSRGPQGEIGVCRAANDFEVARIERLELARAIRDLTKEIHELGGTIVHFGTGAMNTYPEHTPSANEMVLASLINDRHEAKLAEDEAIAARRAIDDKIVSLVGKVDEGTLRADAGTKSVKVTYSLERKVNEEELAKVIGLMPQHVRACFRDRHEVEVRNYKNLEASDPASYEILARTIVTAKPTRPSIKIEDREAK